MKKKYKWRKEYKEGNKKNW